MVAVVTPVEQRAAEYSLNSHLPALDGLRAVAILLVIPHNTSVLASHASALTYTIGLFTNVGWIGVQLFFALSGFLITGNLLESRTAPNYYRAFFGRRVLRIFPLYYLTIFALCVVAPLIFTMPDEFTTSLRHLPWLLLFLSNWTAPFGMSVEGFPHFWSLAIEEQFYLAWPFVVHHCGPARLLRVCVAIVAAALVIRVLMMADGSASGPLYMFTTSRMDALAAGAAMACLLRMPEFADRFIQRANAVTIGTVALLLIGALATRAYSYGTFGTNSYGYSILAVGFAVIVALAAIQPRGPFSIAWRLLSIPPMRMIGRYSYAMYVFHLPLHIFIGTKALHLLAPQPSSAVALTYMLCLVVATFALAALSYRFIESRFLAMKKYFVPAARSV